MIADGFHGFTQIPLVIVGTFLFVIVFVGVSIWTMVNGKRLEKMAYMPLEEDIHE